jgi:hypothetical protein
MSPNVLLKTFYTIQYHLDNKNWYRISKNTSFVLGLGSGSTPNDLGKNFSIG